MIEKMIKFHITKEKTTGHNPNWLQLPNHLYRILIIAESGCGKTNN